MVTAAPWWQEPQTLARVVRDWLMGELEVLRPGRCSWPQAAGSGHAEAPHDVHLADDLQVDSLEMMNLSSGFADFMGLEGDAALAALYAQPSWLGWTELARASLARDDRLMCFQSSGSTGRPRRFMHRLDELVQEARFLAGLLGPRHEATALRLVTVVRSHHIYGFLFGVLLPWALRHRGLQVEVVQASGRAPASVLASLHCDDLLIAFPDWWAAALKSGQALPARVTGTTSTAPCTPELSDALLAAGLDRLVQVYGSSDTAGVGWREWPSATYTLMPFWKRSPEGALLRTAPGGAQRTVQAPDELRWHDERRFEPLRRLDGVVQVGGVNVDPEQVRQRLLQQPGVADAAVRPHVREGAPMRLKAYVVPSSGIAPDTLQAELDAWARRHLSPAQRPVHLAFGPALPRNAMGKASDWAIERDAF